MPLFGSNREPSPPLPAPEPEHHGIFGRKRQSLPPTQVNGHDDGVQRHGSMFSRSSGRTSPTNSNHTNQTNHTSGGFFSLHRGSDSSGDFSHVGNDPSIVSAKQKVTDAERFEREADHALSIARSAVREARDHVRMLEHEAIEGARRAKLKQEEAKSVSKSAKHLGRHG